MSISFLNSPVMKFVLQPRFLIVFAVVAFFLPNDEQDVQDTKLAHYPTPELTPSAG